MDSPSARTKLLGGDAEAEAHADRKTLLRSQSGSSAVVDDGTGMPRAVYSILAFNATLNCAFFGLVTSLFTFLSGDPIALDDTWAVFATNTALSIAYAFSVLGAYLGDVVLGKKRTLLLAAVTMSVGLIGLAFTVSPLLPGGAAGVQGEGAPASTKAAFFVALAMAAAGYGCANPCTSSFMGEQFTDAHDPALTTKAFAWWYSSVQSGSIVAMVAGGAALQTWPAWVFFTGLAAVVTVAGLLPFAANLGQYVDVPPSREVARRRRMSGASDSSASVGSTPGGDGGGSGSDGGDADTEAGAEHGGATAGARASASAPPEAVAQLSPRSSSSSSGSSSPSATGASPPAPARSTSLLRATASAMSRMACGTRKALSPRDAAHMEATYGRRLAADGVAMSRVVAAFVPTPCYWGLYFLIFSGWQVQAGAMHQEPWLPTSDITVLDPLFVLLLTPLLAYVVYPSTFGRRHLATPLARMFKGLLLAAATFGAACGLTAYVFHAKNAGVEPPSILWMVPQFGINAIAEVLFATTAIEYAYVAAPKHLKGTVTCLVWLTISAGNQVVALIALGGTAASGHALTVLFAACSAAVAACALLFRVMTRHQEMQQQLQLARQAKAVKAGPGVAMGDAASDGGDDEATAAAAAAAEGEEGVSEYGAV